MNQELKRQDMPKIAIALGLLLALGSAGLSVSRNAAAQGEQERMVEQMKRESGPGAFVDVALSPEQADEDASSHREADPNLVH